MSGYSYPSYPFQVGADDLMDTAESEEEADINPSIQYNGLQNTAAMTEGHQANHHQAFIQPVSHPQGMCQYQMLSHTQMQHGGNRQYVAQMYNDGTNVSTPFGYTEPAQPLAQGPWYGQGPGPDIGGQRYFEEQADGQSELQAYSNIHSGGQHGAIRTLDHRYDAPDYEMYNQLDGTPASQHIDPRDTVAVPMPLSTMYGNNAGGPDSACFPGYMNRPTDYQDQLGVYVDELVDRVQTNLDTPLAAGQDPYNSSMADRQAAIVTCPFFHTIQSRSSQVMGPVNVNHITGVTIPEDMASEGDSAVVDPDASNVESGISAGGRPRTYSNSRASNVPSPTNADACSEVLYCPVDECAANFTGMYRKGNLGRHYRHKHRGHIVEFSCEDEDCSKVFLRQDARLKHYRNDHSHLHAAPARSRKTSSSTGSGYPHLGYTGSPCVYE